MYYGKVISDVTLSLSFANYLTGIKISFKMRYYRLGSVICSFGDIADLHGLRGKLLGIISEKVSDIKSDGHQVRRTSSPTF